jgi:hypothetical protein
MTASSSACIKMWASRWPLAAMPARPSLGGQLFASHLPAFHGSGQERIAPSEEVFLEAELSIVVSEPRLDVRCAEAQEPADVLGEDEVPARPEDVRAEFPRVLAVHPPDGDFAALHR